MAEFNRIESMEIFPLENRLYMVYKMGEGACMEIYRQGREARKEEITSALWAYHQVLNEAEAQIEALLELVKKSKVSKTDRDDYLEQFPDNPKNSLVYKLQEEKAKLFIALAKKDEKSTSNQINKIFLIEEKLKKPKVKSG
ncbi:hypothetical protein [Belliella pelovolcani]|uniref:hypothetical protein n=1 Tax=Belliella pelovolcani TaxID=529505 RepID=UPI00391A53A2